MFGEPGRGGDVGPGAGLGGGFDTGAGRGEANVGGEGSREGEGRFGGRPADGGGGQAGGPATTPGPRGPYDNPAFSPTEVDLTGRIAERLGVDRSEVKISIGWNKQAKRDQLGAIVKGKAYDVAMAKREERIKSLTPQQQLVDKITTPNGLLGTAMHFAARTFGVMVDPETGAIMGRAGGGMPGGDPAHGAGEAAIQRAIDAAAAAEEEDGKGKTGPEPGTDEYKTKLREEMEAIIGGYMPDYGFELPDWSVIFSLDFPPPEPQGRADGADTVYEDTLQRIYDRIEARAG